VRIPRRKLVNLIRNLIRNQVYTFLANYKHFRIFKDNSFAKHGSNWVNIISLEGRIDICTQDWKIPVPLKILIPKNYPSVPPYVAIGEVKDFHVIKADFLINSFLVKTPMIQNWNAMKMRGTYTLINLCDEIFAFFNTYPPFEMNNKKHPLEQSITKNNNNFSTLDSIIPKNLIQNELNDIKDSHFEDKKGDSLEVQQIKNV